LLGFLHKFGYNDQVSITPKSDKKSDIAKAFCAEKDFAGKYSICKIFKAPVDEKVFKGNVKWRTTFGVRSEI
jgi:hypothetical protein